MIFILRFKSQEAFSYYLVVYETMIITHANESLFSCSGVTDSNVFVKPAGKIGL